MAPTESRISSVEEKRSEAATSSTTSVTSSLNATTKSSSHVSVSGNRTSLLDSGDDTQVTLPITSRGHFYHDSFFEGVRQHFDDAVRKMVEVWDSGSPFDDHLLCYRRMRDLNLSEDNQALAVTHDHKAHRVAIDVRDFVEGDVKVKVVDDNEVVVEGNIEKQRDGSVTKKSFCRRFSFPGLVSEQNVFASMSADGVLTITVPRKDESVDKKEVKNIKITTSQEKSENSENTLKSTTNNHETKDSKVETSSVRSKSSLKETQEPKDLLRERPDGPHSLLPISTRGLFFHDSFFEDSRKHFEAAVDQILQQWDQRDSTTDHMNLYRNLRRNQLHEETQAVSSSEDHLSHKIVVDVQDFKEGDVKVEVVSENELAIKGEVEMREGNSLSKKSFLRRFFFPGLVSAENVSSVMSSDGILTVTVRKTASKSEVGKINEATKSSSIKSMKSVSQASNANKEETQSSKVESSSQTKSFISKSHNTSIERAERSSVQKSDVFGLESLNNKDSNLKVSEDLSKVSLDSSFEDFLFGDKCLPIAPKGLFFSDSFFQDVRRDFETAVSEVLSRHGLTNTVDDQLSCYRSLRQRELSDETQAMRTTEDDNEFKVVMDVQNFKKEDIKVKVEDEREVVVEGHVEKKDGGFWSTRSFCRRFNVPCEVDIKAIASAMSSDGVLTITVPKMKKKIQNRN